MSNQDELRSYLSATEAAKFLNLSVREIHYLAQKKRIKFITNPNGQKMFSKQDLMAYLEKYLNANEREKEFLGQKYHIIELNQTTQKIFVQSSSQMTQLPDESVHLVVTSPPYFNAKTYSMQKIEGDLSSIDDLEEWYSKMNEVWREVYRVLQPGRKLFVNIMNLPIKLKDGTFKTLNLVGRTIDECEKIGFIFKRNIIWQKTNGAKAAFGTYPYPGGILINNMHEFILEFDKPERKGFNKYGHLTKEQREMSKLDKKFWIQIKKSDVWVMKPERSGDGRIHIAPFPYELPYRLIKAFSYVSETVLDPFAGSGTTLLAAADLQRNGIGYEINPKIAYEAAKRLRERLL